MDINIDEKTVVINYRDEGNATEFSAAHEPIDYQLVLKVNVEKDSLTIVNFEASVENEFYDNLKGREFWRFSGWD